MEEPSKRRVKRVYIDLIEKCFFVVGFCDERSFFPEEPSSLLALGLRDAESPSPRISKSMGACVGVISAELCSTAGTAINSAEKVVSGFAPNGFPNV